MQPCKRPHLDPISRLDSTKLVPTDSYMSIVGSMLAHGWLMVMRKLPTYLAGHEGMQLPRTWLDEQDM